MEKERLKGVSQSTVSTCHKPCERECDNPFDPVEVISGGDTEVCLRSTTRIP